MVKLKLSIFLLFIILATSFMPLYADNDIKAMVTSNESTFSEDMSSFAPRKRPKSKKRGKKGGRRGNKGQEQFRIGFELGGNLSSFTYSKEYADNKKAIFGDSYASSSGMGFQAGIYADYNISEYLFVEAGIYGIQRTSEEAFVTTNPLAASASVLTYTPLYLQIPILFGVNFSLSDNFSLNVKVGPYLGFGLAGNVKAVTTITTIMAGIEPITKEEKIDFFGDGVEKLDYGLRAGLGVEFSKITVGFFMDYGLANIFKDAPDNFSMKNFSLGVNVGYRF